MNYEHMDNNCTNEMFISHYFSNTWHMFNCVGTKDNISEESIAHSNAEPGCVLLFNKNFDKASALKSYNKVLFGMARQCIVLLDSGSTLDTDRLSGDSYCVTSCSSVPNADNFYSLRKQICDFLAYVLAYFNDIVKHGKDFSVWMMEKIVVSISENMFSFRLLVGRLWQNYNLLTASGCISTYHKIHANLDVCSYYLEFLLLLDRYQKDGSYFSSSRAIIGFDKYVMLFISDLLWIAIIRFQQHSLTRLQNDSPFSCACVVEAWLMLAKLMEKLHESDNEERSFWIYLNPLLDKVIRPTETSESTFFKGDLELPENFPCKEPEIFKLWLLSHLGELFYSKRILVSDNFIQIESVLKKCVHTDSTMPEAKLSVSILLITPLISKIWRAKSEVIMILWEYFHRRLNTIFYNQNTTPDNMKMIKQSSKSWLKAMKVKLGEKSDRGDSWNLFLRLLGLYLKNCLQKHWHQVRGRIYSKFTPTKLQALSELGVYRLSSLFLMICLTSDTVEASNKLLELLELMNHKDSLRHHISWRAQLTLIRLYLERNVDIETISKPLRKELESINMKDPISLSLVTTLINELQDFLEFENLLNLSGHIFVDSWIPRYLSSCSETNTHQLNTVLISMIIQSQSFPTGTELTPNISKLSTSVWQHVLPFILASTHCTSSCESEAALCYNMTVLALQHPGQSRSFTSIFCRFINSPSVNIKIMRKYLYLVMSDQTAMKSLERMENCQGLIIRAWLRCVILSADESCQDMTSLTQLISELSEIVELRNCQNVNFTEGDSLIMFLKMVASAGSLFTERVSFYLSQIEMCLTRTSFSSVPLTVRLYKCAAAFLEYAPQLVYMKKAHCKSPLLYSIVNHLLLPESIYSHYTKLEHPQEEAIIETLHLFIHALVQLNPRSDTYIHRIVKDLIIQYLPRLVPKPSNTMQNFLIPDVMPHPFLKCFDDTQSIQGVETARFILEVLSANFIANKGKARNSHAALALCILKEVLHNGNGALKIKQLVTECALGSMLEVVMFTEATQVAYRRSIEILQLILNQTNEIRLKQVGIIVSTTKEHLAFSAVYVFKMLECLAQIDPHVVRASLPQIQNLVTIVEQKRDVKYDHGLRRSLEKIDLLLR